MCCERNIEGFIALYPHKALGSKLKSCGTLLKLGSIVLPRDRREAITYMQLPMFSHPYTTAEYDYNEGIEILGLEIRPHNVLRRARIDTVGQVADLVNSGMLANVYGIGANSQEEIEDKLSKIKIIGTGKQVLTRTGNPRITLPSDLPSIIENTVITDATKKLIIALRRQIAAGILHERARMNDCEIGLMLDRSSTVADPSTLRFLCNVLAAPLNLSQEMAEYLNKMPLNRSVVLHLRYGLSGATLEETGNHIGVTRERVRQICAKLERHLVMATTPVIDSTDGTRTSDLPSIRLQSALLIAKDMGEGISLDVWEATIRSSGLVGRWGEGSQYEVDPFELALAISLLGTKLGIEELSVPNNLMDAVGLARLGNPHMPASIARIQRTVPDGTRKLIRRHERFTGGISSMWLVEELQTNASRIESTLQAFGYRHVTDGWYINQKIEVEKNLDKNDVLHHALRKMSLYCGPLTIDAICAGVRNAVSRTTFPVPPPQVMEEILIRSGYRKEEGLIYWDGHIEEEAFVSEQVILECIDSQGPVVHHSDLVEAITESNLSFPSLHAALKRSALIEKVDKALYKLRGQNITWQDMEKAKFSGNRVSADIDVTYDRTGVITVGATISSSVLATGVLYSEALPGLSGDWPCVIGTLTFPPVETRDAEFRNLSEPFRALDCHGGDRVRFRFDVVNRQVEINKIEGLKL